MKHPRLPGRAISSSAYRKGPIHAVNPGLWQGRRVWSEQEELPWSERWSDTWTPGLSELRLLLGAGGAGEERTDRFLESNRRLPAMSDPVPLVARLQVLLESEGGGPRGRG